MAKIKSKFVCQECGYETAKWLGKCPSCEEWNTFVEEFETKKSDSKSQRGISKGIIEKINKITSTKKERISTGSVEMDRVLGGGIIKSPLILVGGDPGIGKSTLLLQVADHAAKQKLKVLYVSGEESGEQIKIRADRLGIGDGELYVLAETNIDIIIEHVDKEEPDLLVLIQFRLYIHPMCPVPRAALPRSGSDFNGNENYENKKYGFLHSGTRYKIRCNCRTKST